MALISNLAGFTLRQVINPVVAQVLGPVVGGALGKGALEVVDFVKKHFTDHSQTLPKALATANDRAWQALRIALKGDGCLDQIRIFFASRDDKGIREQVRLFLQENNLGFEGSSADFRKQCLAELESARPAGLLAADRLSPHEIGQKAADFARYTDLKGLQDGAAKAMADIADELGTTFANLGKLLQQRPRGGPPLLIAVCDYFFRREVEKNQELAHGLILDGLHQLSAGQERAFDQLQDALISLGDQFEQVFDQLDRIEAMGQETYAAVLGLVDYFEDAQAAGRSPGRGHATWPGTTPAFPAQAR